jgi:hypothetical protein
MQRGIRLFRLFTATAFQYFRACCWGIVILFMSMQVTGCAPMKIPPYKADAFNTYQNQVAKNDLHIAIQPMTDKEQQDKYFGVVLTDAGVLAVFIIAENRSASQRFMLRDDLISLQNKTAKQIFPKPLKTDVADDSDLESTRRASEFLGSIFLSLALAKNSVDTKAIQDNLFDKTLYTQTILPGKTAEGFAYFKLSDSKINVSDNKINFKDLLLRIQATDEVTQSIHSFEFGL